ncbi:hypothetical protein FE391_40390 [Nonomuraea sp. KC401]|uniref:DUF11 domain-containing protein n=1 Tax=unclassified Nonomuraea TaxID=2593643 RepID=UPI0010FD15A9|nr:MULTISPECIES: DUF11 domain-containing protein [unclassified Nonomuraea]NBE99792.1 hypothetical protein [Nonomuraea sp. K271]TLF55638.1 hypothetical protein FE391_40390 [Nonomuraea sp. KC401]
MARVATVITLAALGGGAAAPAEAGGFDAGRSPFTSGSPSMGGPPSGGGPAARSGPAVAGLRIAQSVVPDPLLIGRPAVHTVTVTNVGEATAEAVTITGALDEHVSPGPLPDGCDLTGRTITCGGPALRIPAGRSVTRSFPVVIDSGLSDGTALTSRAEVTASGAQGDSSQLVTETRAAGADVTITKAATLTAGGAIAYAVTVVNEGLTPATGVTVRHPAGGRAAIADRPAECPGVGPSLVCPLGTLAPRESRTFMFTLAPGEPGPVENCATVSAESDEANTTNNRACTSTAIEPQRAPAPDGAPSPDEATPAGKPSEKNRARPGHEPRHAAPGEQAEPHEHRAAERKRDRERDRAPRAQRLDDGRPLPMTGVSVWMLGLGTAVLLAIGLLVRYFSRRDRVSGMP